MILSHPYKVLRLVLPQFFFSLMHPCFVFYFLFNLKHKDSKSLLLSYMEIFTLEVA